MRWGKGSRVGWAGLLWVLSVAVWTAPSSPAQSLDSSNPRARISWPWQPGGIFYQRPKFGAVPYTVLTSRDPNVLKGQSLLVQPGQPGFSYGVEGLKRTVAAPTAERIVVGTAAANRLIVDGATYRYDRVLAMMTTAYNGSYAMNGSAGAVAAWNGAPLQKGDVAVDPSVIPFGTYLFVDGYGLARAVDTGSDIIGDHIDLFFNESSQQVSQYGIQYKKVYLLGPVPPLKTAQRG